MKSLDLFLSQIFLSLEHFLQKATTLNIFESLIFNYKIKVNSVDECSPQFVSFVVDLCNELQLILRDSVIDNVIKPESSGKALTPTTQVPCDLQEANTDFVTFSTTLASNEVSDRTVNEGELWQPENQSTNEVQLQVTLEEKPSSPEQEKCNQVYTCEYCNRKYRTKKKLSKHVCKSAPVVTSVQEEDNEEEEEESVDDPAASSLEHFPQTPCETEGEGDSALPVYMCAVCLSTFNQRELFDEHIHADNSQEAELVTDIVKLQSQRKFSCGVCREVYRSLGRISYHTARCHAGPYHCELCSHIAPSKQLLNRHKKKHHKGVESFFCPECGLGFKLRTSLQKHLVNRHETDQMHYPCEYPGCQQVFSKKIRLTNHRIQVHRLERKFLCQVCGHKFMTQDSLTSHLECHATRKRFQCRFCFKVFNTKEKMTLHVRTHTGERPFACNRTNCDKSFVSKSKLTEHLLRHDGEKRHKCGICGKQYANKPDLRTHLKKVHSDGSTLRVTSEDQDNVPPGTATAESVPDLYPPVIMQVESGSVGEVANSAAASQPYDSMHFYPDTLHLLTVPQSVVLASYQTVIGI